MTIKDPSKIDDKLVQIYANQITTTTFADWEDRSQILMEQMNFIALNNKSFLSRK